MTFFLNKINYYYFGDCVKKNIKIILIGSLIGVIISGIFVYSFYFKKTNEKNTVSVFQAGVFKDENSAQKKANELNGIVYKDGRYYRVYVAVYKNEEIIARMEEYYKKNDINYYIKSLNVNSDYLNVLNKYEKMLEASNDEEIYDDLNLLLLKKLESNIL